MYVMVAVLNVFEIHQLFSRSVNFTNISLFSGIRCVQASEDFTFRKKMQISGYEVPVGLECILIHQSEGKGSNKDKRKWYCAVR